MRGQDTILTCLQRDEGVRQHVGSGGEKIRTEEDAIVADLRFVEQPPTPALGEGIAIIELNLDLSGIDSLLARFQAPVQDLHTGRDKVFDHHVMGIVRQDERQPCRKGAVAVKCK